MSIKRKITTLLTVSLLLLSALATTTLNYTTTAQPPARALFTGEIYDAGIDTGTDGLFDYLEVGVEVNVTEAGIYDIFISGLSERINNATRQIWYSQHSTLDLDVGVHVINFSFPGPMIAYYGINPMNLTDIDLVERPYYYQLDYIRTAALSKQYNYTQFNSPFNDMEFEFTVYPNATINVNGSVNHTRIYQPYNHANEPTINATLGFSTSGLSTTGFINGTMMFPENARHEFPFNSTTVDFTSYYRDGILNAQLNATVSMPPAGSSTYPFNSSGFSFSSTYSDGTLLVDLYGETMLPSFYASEFPFNVTDATVLADYADNEINGNITFHVLSGFPLEDVIVYFNGNKTEISFTGYLNVTYGNYFGMDINATTLEELLAQFNSTIPGRGENSLYNMTEGMIECTLLNTTKTPYSGGAGVDYNATLSGNFTEVIARFVTAIFYGPPPRLDASVYAAVDATLSSVSRGSLTLNYYYGPGIASLDLTLQDDVKSLWENALQLLPPTVPPEYMTQMEAWLNIANITAYAVENAYVTAEYSSLEQQLNLHASLTANISQLKNEVIPILPDAVPPEFRDLVESCTNTTYCTLDSFNVTCNYLNGLTNFDAFWILSALAEGDFTAELNHLKRCYVEYLNMTSPYMINAQIRLLNETEWDISNLKANIRQGEDWMTLTFEGLKVHPVKDEIDFIRFKLHQWLNLTSDPYGPPREFEKLKITVNAGFNGTHTILLYAPNTMPTPDTTSLDYKSMTWENVTLSSLKDLLFKIAYQGTIDHLGKTYFVPIFTNSTVTNFNFDPGLMSISFNVTGATGKGFCNITIPRALLYAALGEWTIRFDDAFLIPGEYSVTENAEYVFIYLNYSHSTHSIEIAGTWIITEIPSNILPLIIVILSLIAVALSIKHRKKLDALRAKSQNVIHLFLSRLYQSRT